MADNKRDTPAVKNFDDFFKRYKPEGYLTSDDIVNNLTHDDVVNNLTSDSSVNPLSAAMGVALKLLHYIINNNLISNGDFNHYFRGWTTLANAAQSISNNELTISFTARWGQTIQYLNDWERRKGHKIYFCADIKSADYNNYYLYLNDGINETQLKCTQNNIYQRCGNIHVIDNSAVRLTFGFITSALSGWQNAYLKNVFAIDLTEIYGNGNEPSTTTEIDNILADYQNLPYVYRNNFFDDRSVMQSQIAYYWDNGVRIKLFPAYIIFQMITIELKGNGYGSSPINTIIQCYHYTPVGTFLNYKQKNYGSAIGAAHFYIYDGYIWCWFLPVSFANTIRVSVYTQQGFMNNFFMEHSAKHITGVTNEVTCTLV